MSERSRSVLLASLVPALALFSVSAVGATKWSDRATWPDKKVPVAGAKVEIPSGKEVILDVSTPALGSLTINGKLTFAGQTRPVDFTVVPKREGGKVRITGEFAVKLTDFGVKRPSLMFVPTEDKLSIRFDLVARDE